MLQKLSNFQHYRSSKSLCYLNIPSFSVLSVMIMRSAWNNATHMVLFVHLWEIAFKTFLENSYPSESLVTPNQVSSGLWVSCAHTVYADRSYDGLTLRGKRVRQLTWISALWLVCRPGSLMPMFLVAKQYKGKWNQLKKLIPKGIP